MSIFNLTFNNNENTEIVDKFIDEYAQWHNTGKTPDMGSLDVNYTLELQKKRLDENMSEKKLCLIQKKARLSRRSSALPSPTEATTKVMLPVKTIR